MDASYVFVVIGGSSEDHLSLVKEKEDDQLPAASIPATCRIPVQPTVWGGAGLLQIPFVS